MNKKNTFSLEEAIEKAIKLAGSPLSPSQIIDSIQKYRIYGNDELSSIDTNQINSVVNRKHSPFQDINGRMFPTNDEKWKALLSSLWYVQSVIRGNYHNEDINYIVPALYYFKRLWDCYIHKQIYYHEIHWSISKYIDLKSSELSYEDFTKLLPLLDKIIGAPLPIFSDMIKYVSKNNYVNVKDIFKILQSLDTSIYTSNEYGIFFEYILDQIEISGYGRQITRTPYRVSELMAKLLNAQGGRIYDPVCGSAGSLVEVAKPLMNTNYSIKGSERSYRAAQLAFMNLFVHQIIPSKIINENCFDELLNDDLYDYIIADLPIDGSLSETDLSFLTHKWKVEFPKKRKGFGAILLFIASKLSDKGKAVVTVSESFLSNSGYEEKIRKALLNNDLIECIVGLPAGSLNPYTKGSASIIVINKAKPSYLLNKVKFINSDNFDNSTEKSQINPSELAKLYSEKYTNNESQIVDNEYLISEKTLSARKYTGSYNDAIKLIRDQGALSLGDLVHIKSGFAIDKSKDTNSLNLPYVKIENLEKDVLDMYLSPSKLNSYIDASVINNKTILYSEALLIARIGDNLKPTLFKPSNRVEAIAVHSNVYILQTKDTQDLDLEYLYYQLYSPFVLGQIEERRNGSIMSSFNKKELEQIIIPYMELDAQKSSVASQKANVIAAEKEKMNQRIQSIGYEEKGMQIESNIVQTLVHELRPKLVKINTYAKKIDRILNRQNIGSLCEYDTVNNSEFDDLSEPEENLTLQEISNIIITDSLDLSDILSSVKDIMSFKIADEDFIKVDLYNFIDSYFEEKRREIGDRYALELRGDHILSSINKPYFKALLDQLILNAEKHGFENNAGKKHKISISLRLDKQKKIIYIKYHNNGNAFTLKHKDYISALTKSKQSNGSGIGGNYIYRIIKAHKGNMLVKENQIKGFTIEFELPTNPNEHE